MRRVFLLAEALVVLVLASLLIALLPFRRVAALATGGDQGRKALKPAEARAIARAVQAWGRRVPWRAVCFQQGLAAQLMLRRRGYVAQLCYGAARDEDGRLIAHVWVVSDETDVIGCEECDRYGLLAVFPPHRTTA